MALRHQLQRADRQALISYYVLLTFIQARSQEGIPSPPPEIGKNKGKNDFFERQKKGRYSSSDSPPPENFSGYVPAFIVGNQ